MTDSPQGSDASHESDNDAQAGGNSKASGNKDKECQFCHQKFTSSSLGRHLDQFISKKKADGVHNIDEIRKIRASITRRTARSKKHDGAAENTDSHERSTQQSPVEAVAEGPTPSFLESLNRSAAGTNDIRFNRAGWQSTGVLTDTPSITTSGASVASPTVTNALSSTSALAGSKRNFSTYAADLPSSAADNIRALELSLREVLDAVSSATKRAAPLPEPFPFDITTKAFPALVLALLPTPATLFQSVPFSTPTTIPLQPPGVEHFQALRTIIRETLDQWKWDALAHIQRASIQSSMNISEEAARLSEVTQAHIDKGLRHLDAAYSFFASSPPDQQHQQWTLELLRAFKNEQDKTKEANERIVRIMQEASQLQQQIDYLSRCQWPREMALWPPKRNTFNSAEQKELSKVTNTTTFEVVAGNGTAGAGMASSATNTSNKWDFDKLVDKWKRHVREDRARRGTAPIATSGSSMLPPVTIPTDHANDISTGISVNPSTVSTNGTTMRKSMSDAMVIMNGGSQTASPTNRSFRLFDNAPSINTIHNSEKSTGGNTTTPSGLPRPFSGTLSSNNSVSATPQSRSQSSLQQRPPSNVQIVSDAEEHFSRFLPYLKQRDLEERQARNGYSD